MRTQMRCDRASCPLNSVSWNRHAKLPRLSLTERESGRFLQLDQGPIDDEAMVTVVASRRCGSKGHACSWENNSGARCTERTSGLGLMTGDLAKVNAEIHDVE